MSSDDVRVPVGSETGSDIKLSKKAITVIPCKFECKSRAKISVYTWFQQATNHKGELEPVLVVKQNRKEPLAIVNLDFLLDLLVTRNKKNG